MKIIDVHHHWINEEGYLPRLLSEMDRLGVERTGLIALGAPFRRLFLTRPEPFGCCDNQDLARAVREHPDRFYGYGFIRLGRDPVETVDWCVDNGLAGLKFHIPALDYDDERCFPVYERAQKYGLPCLFHTGVFSLPEPLPGERVSSARCRPIMLDSIANEFPSLRMIIAHLGVCWGEEAATLCRIYPHIYADLSGSLTGWLSSKDDSWLRQMLYWDTAHRKILFGSDVHCSQLEAALQLQRQALERIGWDSQRLEAVFHGNARGIFGG